MTQTVLFVCPHGAGMSRIAAAWFNLVAPESLA
jgi:protein-tyrosine-phosphatase